MLTFTYIGYNDEGKRKCGSGRYAKMEDMRQHLESAGIKSFEVFESRTEYSTKTFRFISPKELSIFCRQMSVLFFSHITLMEGMLLLSEQSENKQLKIALREIYSHMERGYTFAQSIGMYDHLFTPYLLNMIIIGEESGTLDTVLAHMSGYYEKEARMRKKLRAAVMYPAVLSVLMAGIILVLILKILPMFNDILMNMGGEMPAVTSLILSGSLFITRYLPVIALVLAAVILALIFYARSEPGGKWLDRLKVSVPVGKFLNSRVITSRFARSMAILLKSGVQILNAMGDVAQLIENRYIKEQFAQAERKVRDGQELSDALSDMGIFPPLFLKMVIVGQKTGHLDEILDRSASIFDEEVDDAIERI
ncbi:MAG: type II secretion system F family protein, partial [Clostridiales bacterium]|nr:type II secretion system F family protein [Clostridiales bacterium]